jgi:hypothetical protein
MYSGTTIDELIQAVQKAERDARMKSSPEVVARVTRYDANPGFVYAMQFAEAPRVMCAASGR